MSELWLIVFGTALANQALLTHFVGLDATVLDAHAVPRARRISVLTAAVLLPTGAATWWIGHLWLNEPGDASLRLQIGVLVATAVALPVEHAARTVWPAHVWRPERRLPLLLANTYVLGATLLVTANAATFWHALLRLTGLAFGFAVLMLIMAGLQDRLAGADVPDAFHGGPIAVITLGLLALAFNGLTGMAGG